MTIITHDKHKWNTCIYIHKVYQYLLKKRNLLTLEDTINLRCILLAKKKLSQIDI